MSNAAKRFDILASLSVLHNYFDCPVKLFSNLYLNFYYPSAKNHPFYVSKVKESLN